MNFQTAVKTCFQKYATFSGRALRSEYWWWFLFVLLLNIASATLDASMIGDIDGPISAILAIGLLLPNLAVSVRRLHDIDRSGWWFLILLIPLVGLIMFIFWMCQESTYGANKYGNDPREA